MFRLFRNVLPVARREIEFWTDKAQHIPDEVLRTQALASLQQKRFHADGGSVYAAVNPLHTEPLVRLIVALQTISDYLDNLCDRCDVYDEQDFHQLHHAMRDAVRPEAELRDYYQYRGPVQDGGYLPGLVKTCQSVVRQLPGYATVRPYVEWLVERYCELQAYKHIDPALRWHRLEQWCARYKPQFPDLHWWEFAAATGSTLGMFSLFLASTRPVAENTAKQLYQAYFPWVGGLHILLDYLIDLEEDQREGDFNFVQCYADAGYAMHRIRHFARQSWEVSKHLEKGQRIHRDVVKGLLGMYLSDDKVRRQRDVKAARRLVWEFGPTAWLFYAACVLYRRVR